LIRLVPDTLYVTRGSERDNLGCLYNQRKIDRFYKKLQKYINIKLNKYKIHFFNKD